MVEGTAGGDLCRKKWQELALHVSQAERVTSQLTKDSAEQVRLFHSISFPPTLLSCAGSCREGSEEGARKAGGVSERGERSKGAAGPGRRPDLTFNHI